jgi:hypothetical protein
MKLRTAADRKGGALINCATSTGTPYLCRDRATVSTILGIHPSTSTGVFTSTSTFLSAGIFLEAFSLLADFVPECQTWSGVHAKFILLSQAHGYDVLHAKLQTQRIWNSTHFVYPLANGR